MAQRVSDGGVSLGRLNEQQRHAPLLAARGAEGVPELLEDRERVEEVGVLVLQQPPR